MNLVTLITGILIVMAVVELLLHGMSAMKRDLFYIAILVAWVGFTSKYYYGPDIRIYTMLYSHTESLSGFFQGHYPGGYEPGYMLYLSLCQTLGLSFWWMTAIISTLFFYTVFVAVRRLEDKRVLALTLIVVLVPDLIYAEFRQCLAVSFFTLALLNAERWSKSGYNNRRDLMLALLFGFISVAMHKSALFMVVPTVIYYMMQPYRMHTNTWSVLLLLLVLLVIIPTQELIVFLTERMGLDHVTMHTIKMHFAYSKQFQTNLLVYGAALVVLVQFARQRQRRGTIVAAASVGMIVVVVFYQYYMMVNRLKSYFVIFAVYYIFSQMRTADFERMPYVSIVRQVCELLLIVFMSYKMYVFDVNSRRDGGDILEASTVFELVDKDANVIKNRQLAKAEKYWDSGFLKSDLKNRRADYKSETKQ